MCSPVLLMCTCVFCVVDKCRCASKCDVAVWWLVLQSLLGFGFARKKAADFCLLACGKGRGRALRRRKQAVVSGVQRSNDKDGDGGSEAKLASLVTDVRRTCPSVLAVYYSCKQGLCDARVHMYVYKTPGGYVAVDFVAVLYLVVHGSVCTRGARCWLLCEVGGGCINSGPGQAGATLEHSWIASLRGNGGGGGQQGGLYSP